MYTEGFEEFEDFNENEKSNRRTYVSNVSQDEGDRLLRENEQLKKALEKEQFFNKLLDQEIQELKAKGGQTTAQVSDYWYGNRGVSKGAFYSLLFVALAMAGYIGYGFYTGKESDKLTATTVDGTVTSDESAPTFTTPSGNNQSNLNGEAQPAADEKINNTTPLSENTTETAPSTAPTVKDSVPNIVAKQEPERIAPEATRVAPEKPKAAPEAEKEQEIDVEKARIGSTSAPVDMRPVIARYKISSKANFYSRPDEDAMRSAFISQGEDKVVGALEDRNGFIYVVYTNDLGYTSRGWLSKKDLTKLE